MKIYLVVYSDEESYSIEGTFLLEEKAKEFRDQYNKKELKFWEKSLKERPSKLGLTAEDLAMLVHIDILEVVE